MAEALAALSVAGTVLQFVDFSSKIINRTYRLVRDSHGQIEPEHDLASTTIDLVSITSKLQRPLGPEDGFGPLTQDEQLLKDICDGCGRIAEELLQKLKALDAHGKVRPWKAFQTALYIAWTKNERKELRARLSTFQKQLDTRVLIGLRKSLHASELEQIERFNNLDTSSRTIVASMLDMKGMLQDDDGDILMQTRAIAHRLNRMNDDALRAQEEDKEEAIAMAVTKTLKYPSQMERVEKIPDAHKETFRWVFKDGGTGEWDSFNEWLQSGSGLYWINGKAGSGKSTLMRYIYENDLTDKRLRIWAERSTQPEQPDNSEEPAQLVKAGFFFWNSGTMDQRSKSGLLRSLLHEVLTKHPVLIPAVLPEFWARQYSKVLNPLLSIEYDVQRLPRLLQAFKNLVNQTIVPIKLCFFIDGLDEYDGEDKEIARIFSELQDKPNIKICASSRPSRVFEESFKNAPSLKLQELTKNDIKAYVDDVLGNDELYVAQSRQNPDLASSIEKELIEKAEGVFLWVALVVKSLNDGLLADETIIDLQKRLRSLPRGLEALYKHMLEKRIGPDDLPRAAQYLQILRAGLRPVPTLYHIADSELKEESERKQLTILDLALADEDNTRLLASSTPDKILGEIEAMCESMRIRLNAKCVGLVEVQGYRSLLEVGSGTKRRTERKVEPDDKVQYLHRTVRDFLETDDLQKLLVEKAEQASGKLWNPSTCLLRSCIALLSVARNVAQNVARNVTENPLNEDAYRSIAFRAMVHAHQADCSPSPEYFQLLQQLDDVMCDLNTIETSTQISPHWATHRCSVCGRGETNAGYEDIPETHDSFMSLAVQYGLSNYLDHCLKRDKQLLKGKPGRPLLDYAVWPAVIEHEEERFPASPEVVRVLLQHGASPNQSFNNGTCWENALTFLILISEGTNLDTRFILGRLEAIALLLGAGASRAAIKTPDGMLTPQTIMETVVDKWCPQEQGKVQKMFESRSRTMFLLWLGSFFGLAS